jgi:tetratricopeptide (TPR) repeat protein
MSIANGGDFNPSPGDRRWCEDAAERFEDCWIAGSGPEIEDYLPAEGPRRWALLVELVRVDLEYRLKAGQAARVEEYIERFPELAGDRDTVLTLVQDEYRLRRRVERDLTRQEYIERLPDYREQLLADPSLATMAGAEAEGASPGIVSAIPTTLAEEGPPPSVAVPGAPTLAGYEILDELGHGAMGVVYLAGQIEPKRPVALKMILPGAGAWPGMLERFRIEADAVARLKHPNIVEIHEVGVQGGRPFICLEYAPGGSLARKLAGTPQPPADAARMVQTLARAVQSAHQCYIVHRDLKPDNVLLMADGTPQDHDFGLAKLLDAEQGLSRTGIVMGTPCYMAPEQAEGKKIGPLADVYALGAILYEMLTGRPPFKATTIGATLAQVKNQEPVPPRRLRRKLPRDLDTICLKCLEKDPRRRYADAEELAEDLGRFLAGEPIKARPIGIGARALKWAKRRPAQAGLILAGTIAGVCLLALSNNWYQQKLLREARDRYRSFKELRDEAFYWQMPFINENSSSNLKKTIAAAGDALDTFGVSLDSGTPLTLNPSHFSQAERDEIRTGCYELLLIRADAVAHPLAARESRQTNAFVRVALQSLDRAAALGISTKSYHLRRARYLEWLGQEAGARQESRWAEGMQPTSASDYFLLGAQEYRSDKFQRASSNFEAVLRLQPNYFGALYGSAMCDMNGGRWAGAKAYLTICLGRHPDLPNSIP